LNWRKQCLCRFRINKGSVLILALWSLFFLSALALAIAAYVHPQLRLAGRFKDKVTVCYLAESGVKKAMAQIVNTVMPGYDTLKEFLPSGKYDFREMGVAEGEFNYAVVDEERKININKSSYDILERFFETAAGLTPQQAGDISACIMDWREAGEKARKNGAKSSYYQSLDPPYPCKNKDFELLDEVLLVKGVTPDIFNEIKDRITVYGTGAVNINTADKLVLKSLGMSDSLADKIIHFRNGSDGIEGTSDDNYFSAVENIATILQAAEKLKQDELNQLTNIVFSGLLCVRSNNFRGESSAKAAKDYVRVDFVFNRDKTIKFWREE